MRQSHTETGGHGRRRAATLFITTVVSVVALTGATAAQAAPRDNWQHARQCLRGGWHTLKMANGKSFRGVLDCYFYAMRGGRVCPVHVGTSGRAVDSVHASAGSIRRRIEDLCKSGGLRRGPAATFLAARSP